MFMTPNKIFLTIIAVMILGIFGYLFFAGTRASNPVLSEEEARELLTSKWNECGETECRDLSIRVLDNGEGIWYVERVWTNLMGDSVSAIKRTVAVYFSDGRCQTYFTPELCI